MQLNSPSNRAAKTGPDASGRALRPVTRRAPHWTEKIFPSMSETPQEPLANAAEEAASPAPQEPVAIAGEEVLPKYK